MKLAFDGRIKLEFHGSKVTSDGGLLVYRDFDYLYVLFDTVSAVSLKIVEVMITNIDKRLFTEILARIERL